MPLTIPQFPAVGDRFQVDNRLWEWDGNVWKSLPIHLVSEVNAIFTDSIITNSVIRDSIIDNPTFTNTQIDAGTF